MTYNYKILIAASQGCLALNKIMRGNILAHSKDSVSGSYFCCNYSYHSYRVFLQREIKENKQTTECQLYWKMH